MKNGINILVTEPEVYGEKSRKILKKIGRLSVQKVSSQQLTRIIGRFDVLAVGHELILDKNLLMHAKKLKIIATPTTGIDHIDTHFALKMGIKIISLRGETNFLNNVHATAEHTMALILSLIRKIPWSFDCIKKRAWKRKQFFGTELFGKNLGIIGLGRLGKKIACYGQAFKMNVISYDPAVSRQVMARNKVGKTTLSNLLKKSDIIVLLPSLNKSSVNLISFKEFKLMKRGSILINTSRGRIVDEIALLEALKSRRISAAALDVLCAETEKENPLINNKLIEYARKKYNLLITPHIAGATEESLEKTSVFIANKIKELTKNEKK